MKHNGFSLTNNEWLVMEQLWARPCTLMELVRDNMPCCVKMEVRSAFVERESVRDLNAQP